MTYALRATQVKQMLDGRFAQRGKMQKTIKEIFSKTVIEKIIYLINQIQNKNYNIIRTEPFYSRCNPEDVERVIREYNRTIIEVPIQEIENTEVIKLIKEKDTFAIDIDLWTIEEGRSDLTLQIIVENNRNKSRIGIEDLHVL